MYEPYLLMNYGTSDVNKIRKKTVKYKDKEYDRINLLLDNDMNSEENNKLMEEVVNYESKDLKTVQLCIITTGPILLWLVLSGS